MKGYRLLTEFLKGLALEEIELSFEELEKILGHKLPASINQYAHSFFSNSEKNAYFKYWKEAGFSAKVLPKERCLIFKRTDFTNAERFGANTGRSRACRNGKKTCEYKYKEIFIEEIEQEHQNVLESFNYGKEAKILADVLNRYPKNDDVTVIAMKIAVVDVTNSTQLSKYKSKISLFDLANIILKIENFDERVAQGDEELVNIIARESKKNYHINLFSFASKYCCYHNVDIYKKDDYSIYDSVLHDHLGKYIEGLTKTELSRCKDKFDYQTYNRYIGELLVKNGIDIAFKRRKFDHFIWFKHKDDNKK